MYVFVVECSILNFCCISVVNVEAYIQCTCNCIEIDFTRPVLLTKLRMNYIAKLFHCSVEVSLGPVPDWFGTKPGLGAPGCRPTTVQLSH